MNVYMMVDMEGISGVSCRAQVDDAYGRYAEGRSMLTRDVNTCVEALKEAGVDKIYVRDCHGSGNNVIWENLSPLADYYIVGTSGENRYPGLEDCDAVILLGYHGMAGTAGAVLEHSMSSTTIQNYWINGEKAGEIAIDAGSVGDLGKPVIMVSGDDKLCAEAKALMPWVVTAETKKGMTWTGAMLVPMQKAQALLREKIHEAVQSYPQAKLVQFAKPITLRVELTERKMVPNTKTRPGVKIIDGRTYEVTGDTMSEAFSLSM